MSGFKFIGRKALGGQSAGSGRHISQVVQNLFILTDLGLHKPPSSPGFALVKRGSVDPSKKIESNVFIHNFDQTLIYELPLAILDQARQNPAQLKGLEPAFCR